MTKPPALTDALAASAKDIDALAYIDQLTQPDREAAEALIDKELQAMRKEGIRHDSYTADMKPASAFCAFPDNPVMKAEMERIDQGQKHMPPLDMTNTRLETPRLNQQEDLKAWQQSASNAHAQLEHQHCRVVNLKLGIKYGPAAWRAQNARTESLIKAADKRLQQAEARITRTNQRRKLKQEQAKADLDRLQLQYETLVRKNTDIDLANHELEAEIAQHDNAGAQGADGAQNDGAIADALSIAANGADMDTG